MPKLFRFGLSLMKRVRLTIGSVKELDACCSWRSTPKSNPSSPNTRIVEMTRESGWWSRTEAYLSERSSPVQKRFPSNRVEFVTARKILSSASSLRRVYSPRTSARRRRLNCHEKINLVIEGRSFKDGIMHEQIAA
jgi:hypothetical protein